MSLITFQNIIDNNVSSNEIDQLESAMSEKNYYGNSEIICDKQNNGTVYLVKEGVVKITEKDSSGNLITSHYLYAGDLFNEFISNNEEQRTFSAEAVTSCRVASLTYETIENILSPAPHLHKTIIHRLTEMYSNMKRIISSALPWKKQYTHIHSLDQAFK